MEMEMDFNKLWSGSTDIDYEPAKTVELLGNFNKVIDGLYALSGETRFIADVLNSSTYEIAEYDRLIATVGDLATIADTLEMARNLMFGGCVDWEYVLSGFRELAKRENANKAMNKMKRGTGLINRLDGSSGSSRQRSAVTSNHWRLNHKWKENKL